MQIQQWMNANTTGGAQLIALAPLPDELHDACLYGFKSNLQMPTLVAPPLWTARSGDPKACAGLRCRCLQNGE